MSIGFQTVAIGKVYTILTFHLAPLRPFTAQSNILHDKTFVNIKFLIVT